MMHFWRKIRVHLMAWALLGLLLALLVWPILSVVQAGFKDEQGWTLFYFKSVFTSSLFLGGLGNSLMLALYSTALCAVISIPLAWVMNSFEFPFKKMLSSLLLVPLILPPFVGALGLRRLLAPSGGPIALLCERLGLVAPGAMPDLLALSPFLATALLISLHLYPILFLNVQAALANIDPTLEEAAQNVGAGKRRIFFRITLPLMMPGLFAGATIVFIWSFTELGTPLMVGYRDVTAVQVFDRLAQLESNPQPYALIVVLLLASVLGYVAGKLAMGRGGHAMISKASIARRMHRMPAPVAWGVSGLVALLIVAASLPHIGVVMMALADRWQGTILPHSWTVSYMGQVLTHSITGPSIINSLKYASLATVLDVILGIALGFVIVRTKVRWRGLLDSLAMLPLAVPGLVMAFGFLSVTRRGSPLQFLNPDLGDPTWLLVIAYGIRRLPYMVRAVVAGLQQTSVVLEEAAINLGASTFHTVRRVTLPLITANMVAGGILAFSFAVLEVSDSLILAFKDQHFPITKAIYQLGFRLGDGNQMACALGVVGMFLLTGTLVGASRLLGKKLGALFRV